MKDYARKPLLTNRWLAAALITTMLLLTLLITATALLNRNFVRAAQTCWRDTPCTGPAEAAFPGTWDKYNYSPASRTAPPLRVLSADNTYLGDWNGNSTLQGNGSILVFDFGQEVGGIVHVTYSARGTGRLGLAFSEARNWTGEWSDSSNGSFNPDGALYCDVVSIMEANYTMPDDKMRGGFRYLTLFSVANDTSSNSTFEIDLLDIVVEISFQPDWPNLRAYGGYFSSSDDLLNKIWYAGAYTLQTNAIPPTSGRAFPILGSGWENNENLNLGTSGSTIYVDGSKRDRTVWSGDLAVAVPSTLVSTGDVGGVKNTLQVLWNDQASTGELPFAGPYINIYGSDTYHMAILLGMYDYLLFTNDTGFLTANWDKYKAAMVFITAKIDSTGMLYVTGTNDWGRLNQGGHNTEANMLMYQTLITGSSIALWTGDTVLSSNWSSLAATLKAAINQPSNLWDESVGAFRDSDTDSTLHPQDGNSLAVLFSAANATYSPQISSHLTTTWNPLGAPAPELPNNHVGFGQSLEIKAHLSAHQPLRALQLIRTAWGWYLTNPSGTASTCIEGYLTDGTFGYRATTGYDNDASYTSHAHGWSTGPTDALTSWVVGMRFTKPGGAEWRLEPQLGDLQFAKAGFTAPGGRWEAGWSLVGDSGGGFDVNWDVPAGTNGTVVLPVGNGGNGTVSVKLDGNDVDVGGGGYDHQAGTFTMSGEGGAHVVEVRH